MPRGRNQKKLIKNDLCTKYLLLTVMYIKLIIRPLGMIPYSILDKKHETLENRFHNFGAKVTTLFRINK